VQADQAAAHGRHVGSQLADLGQGHRIGRRNIGQRFTQAGNQAGLFVFGKHLHIHAKSGVDLQQHRDGERPLVLFQLVQVAGRQPQRVGQRELGHAALFAQAAQAYAHEGFFHLKRSRSSARMLTPFYSQDSQNR